MSEQGARAPDLSPLFDAMPVPHGQSELVEQALEALREGARAFAGSLSPEAAAARQLALAREVFALAVDGIAALSEAGDPDDAARRLRERLAELAEWPTEA